MSQLLDYIDAPEVKEIAQMLIDSIEDHASLRDAKIGYVFKANGNSWRKDGELVLGQAIKLSPRERFFSGLELLVVINKSVWPGLPPQTKKALVDHELSHFMRDNGRWRVVGHDVEDFIAVIRRHGPWHRAARELVVAGAEQLALFDEPAKLKVVS